MKTIPERRRAGRVEAPLRPARVPPVGASRSTGLADAAGAIKDEERARRESRAELLTLGRTLKRRTHLDSSEPFWLNDAKLAYSELGACLEVLSGTDASADDHEIARRRVQQFQSEWRRSNLKTQRMRLLHRILDKGLSLFEDAWRDAPGHMVVGLFVAINTDLRAHYDRKTTDERSSDAALAERLVAAWQTNTASEAKWVLGAELFNQLVPLPTGQRATRDQFRKAK